ncbi:hypothetical protein ONZ45_g4046 [Pleurotus djamor]|nr:hypothetical protein ONZ45_g4046 [Pleurotus djamor]
MPLPPSSYPNPSPYSTHDRHTSSTSTYSPHTQSHTQYNVNTMLPHPNREYELTVRQEPKQARMCGVGGKADRRPIDPPPIVQLRVVDPMQRNPHNRAGYSRAGDHGNIPPHQRRRASSAHGGVDDDEGSPTMSDGARDLDDDPHHSHGGGYGYSGASAGYANSYLQNPYYFMFASLAKPDNDTELHWLKDGRTRYTEHHNEDAGFFVFPDLSVRTEGSYRLKLSLFEVVGNTVRHCKSIFSTPFYVYTAKKFPGMEESTPLSCSLADQGIKIRIRKDIRVRKRPNPELQHPLSDPTHRPPHQMMHGSSHQTAHGRHSQSHHEHGQSGRSGYDSGDDDHGRGSRRDGPSIPSADGPSSKTGEREPKRIRVSDDHGQQEIHTHDTSIPPLDNESPPTSSGANPGMSAAGGPQGPLGGIQGGLGVGAGAGAPQIGPGVVVGPAIHTSWPPVAQLDPSSSTQIIPPPPGAQRVNAAGVPQPFPVGSGQQGIIPPPPGATHIAPPPHQGSQPQVQPAPQQAQNATHAPAAPPPPPAPFPSNMQMAGMYPPQMPQHLQHPGMGAHYPSVQPPIIPPQPPMIPQPQPSHENSAANSTEGGNNTSSGSGSQAQQVQQEQQQQQQQQQQAQPSQTPGANAQNSAPSMGMPAVNTPGGMYDQRTYPYDMSQQAYMPSTPGAYVPPPYGMHPGYGPPQYPQQHMHMGMPPHTHAPPPPHMHPTAGYPYPGGWGAPPMYDPHGHTHPYGMAPPPHYVGVPPSMHPGAPPPPGYHAPPMPRYDYSYPYYDQSQMQPPGVPPPAPGPQTTPAPAQAQAGQPHQGGNPTQYHQAPQTPGVTPGAPSGANASVNPSNAGSPAPPVGPVHPPPPTMSRPPGYMPYYQHPMHAGYPYGYGPPHAGVPTPGAPVPQAEGAAGATWGTPTSNATWGGEYAAAANAAGAAVGDRIQLPPMRTNVGAASTSPNQTLGHAPLLTLPLNSPPMQHNASGMAPSGNGAVSGGAEQSAGYPTIQLRSGSFSRDEEHEDKDENGRMRAGSGASGSEGQRKNVLRIEGIISGDK